MVVVVVVMPVPFMALYFPVLLSAYGSLQIEAPAREMSPSCILAFPFLFRLSVHDFARGFFFLLPIQVVARDDS